MGRRAGLVSGGIALSLVLGAGGYVAADAYDLVPGFVTVEPVPPPPAPFPTVPAAVDPPPLVPVLAEVDPAAPVPSPEAVTALAQALTADPRMGTSTGIVVADALTGEVLAEVDPATPRTPASTAKLLTDLAAIAALGPDRTFSTTVVQPAPGTVVLVGGGDMMLSAGAGDPEAVLGRAGLVELAAATARQLRLAGTTEVELGLDDSLFSGPGLNPGWRPGDIAAGYVASVAPIAVDIARLRADEEYSPRHADPALAAARTFASLLTEQGITVLGGPSRRTAPSGSLELARVESAPVRDVVRYAVQHSDNTITEVLGRMVAVERGLPGSFEGATTAVLGQVAEEGVGTAGSQLADCSGLADGSLLSAQLLSDLLLLAGDAGRTDLLPVLVDLPVAGWSGTLAERFRDAPARGLVRAKTGSLPGVTSLAGTVETVDGRQLVFVVLASATPPGGQPGPRAAIDGFVQQLAGCGCQVP